MNWIETYLGVPIVLSMIGIMILIERFVKGIADDVRTAISTKRQANKLRK